MRKEIVEEIIERAQYTNRNKIVLALDMEQGHGGYSSSSFRLELDLQKNPITMHENYMEIVALIYYDADKKKTKSKFVFGAEDGNVEIIFIEYETIKAIGFIY